VGLLVAVASFVQRYDSVCPKRIEHPGDRIDWDSRSTRHRDLRFDLEWVRQCDENQKEGNYLTASSTFSASASPKKSGCRPGT
jgi:hypothetical protein